MIRQWSHCSSSIRGAVFRRSSAQASRTSGRSFSTAIAAASSSAASSWSHGNHQGVHARDLKGHPLLTMRALSAAAQEPYAAEEPPFKKIMAANRGEIATRIMRAGSELSIPTVGIYSHEGALFKLCVVVVFSRCILHLLLSLLSKNSIIN